METFVPPQGSVLFAAADAQKEKEKEKASEAKLAAVDNKTDSDENDENSDPGINLPSSQLIILVCAAATIALLLGYYAAPVLQSDVVPWFQQKFHGRTSPQLPTVLASTQAPKSDFSPNIPSAAVETASFDQLKQIAEKGDPVAENALGLRYATGEGVKLNESEAVRWFTKAAEQGNVAAQSKLGSIYFSGRGVAQDANRAYFWMVVARSSGDDASKTLSPFVRARLTRAQVTAIELDAERWVQQHHPYEKPAAGQLKARN